jgi:hypothetical protein
MRTLEDEPLLPPDDVPAPTVELPVEPPLLDPAPEDPAVVAPAELEPAPALPLQAVASRLNRSDERTKEAARDEVIG